MSAFQGFPKEGFAFLAGLSRHNDKAWFEAHREAYDRAIQVPALALVAELGARLKKRVPSLKPEPKIGGSLFRIHRDTRFSADKSPYKTHVGIRLRDGDTATSSKCSGPLFYLELRADRLRLGSGIKEFDPATQEAFRRKVAGRAGAKRLQGLIDAAEERGHTVAGEVLARLPAAYATAGAGDLLRRKGLFIMEEMAMPAIVHEKGFIKFCEDWFKPYVPLFEDMRSLALEGRKA